MSFLSGTYICKIVRLVRQTRSEGDGSVRGQCCDDDKLCLGWGMTQKVVRPVQYYTRTVILTTMPTQAMSKCSMNNEAKKASFMVIDLA